MGPPWMPCPGRAIVYDQVKYRRKCCALGRPVPIDMLESERGGKKKNPRTTITNPKHHTQNSIISNSNCDKENV